MTLIKFAVIRITADFVIAINVRDGMNIPRYDNAARMA